MESVLGKREREGEEAVVVKEVVEDILVKKSDEGVPEAILVETIGDAAPAAAPASMDVDAVLSVDTVLVEVVLPTFVEEPVLGVLAVQESVVEGVEKGVEEVKQEADAQRGIAAADAMEEDGLKTEVAVMKEEVKVVDVEGKAEKEVNAETEAEKEVKGVTEKEQEPVQLGPKTFQSGVEMFTYFYDLLHAWVANIDVNKYEYMVLSELISKGHRDAGSKIGPGIKSFQIRFHPGWHSRCYYLLRVDGSVDDFSYRKCVDKIMKLPESLFTTSGDLVVERLFGTQDNKWAKKQKVSGGFEGGGGRGRGNHSRGGRNSHGGRRGGGRGGGHWNH